MRPRDAGAPMLLKREIGRTRRPTSRRRILVLLPCSPSADAVHGGGRVAAALLGMIARCHDVAVLYLQTEGEPPMSEGLRRTCAFVIEVPRPTVRSEWEARRRRLAAMLRLRPMATADWQTGKFRRAAARAIAQWRPDIIQIEHLVMAQYLSICDPRVPKLLTIHEPGTLTARERASAATGFVASAAARLEVALWERFERHALEHVQAAVVFTARDRRAVEHATPGTPIAQIPLGATIPDEPLNPTGSSPPRVCFVGSFIHPPNVDAAIRLARDIFPTVRDRVPDAHLDLVGADPPANVVALANASVTVTGRVPSVTPFLDAASVVVAPIRRGGGMRVKVLEALACGKPLVASPIALEGLADMRDGKEVLLAETDEQFADAITRLLADAAQRVTLAIHAREWACANLGWNLAAASYERLYEQLTNARSVAWSR
ncbi:MAG TPA: glycosyltransferase family 4 protein [Chloroflexota bacterium]|nr:glycosyltransferase family 4 protein [Chloroflexota bacterium]